MPFLKYLLLLLILVFHSGHADECDASTTPRNFELGKKSVAYQLLDQDKGDYVVLFEDGDLLLASFNQCGLGLHAHYYSRKELSAAQRIEYLNWMLLAVLPSRDQYDRLKSQTTTWPDPENEHIMTVSDDTESHDFVFRASQSPLFTTALHYTWNPPEY